MENNDYMIFIDFESIQELDNLVVDDDASQSKERSSVPSTTSDNLPQVTIGFYLNKTDDSLSVAEIDFTVFSFLVFKF